MYFREADKRNFNNTKRPLSAVEFVVMHYDAGTKATARNNVDAFATHVTETSAHFFVDENEVAQSVLETYPAWHCGGHKYKNGAPAPYHGICKNYNSIGIEMCSRMVNNRYVIPKATQERAACFAASLLRKYNLAVDRLIRHYDVTGKHCPAPMVVEESEWNKFKALVMKYYFELNNTGGVDNAEVQEKEKKEGVQEMTYYETLEQIPEGEIRDTVEKYVEKGIINGNSQGLHLSEDMVRMAVFFERRMQDHLRTQN